MPFVAVNIIKVLVVVALYAFLLYVARSMRGHLTGPPATTPAARSESGSGETPPAPPPALFVGEHRHSLDHPRVIGRGAQADIHIEDEYASERHATIGLEGSTIWVEDHGSTNGTTVDGARIEGRVQVGRGTTLIVGRTKMVIR